MKRYDISAVPHAGSSAFFRAGKRWTMDPTTVTLVTGDVAGEGEITEAQLAQLKAEPRIKVYPHGKHTEEAPEPAPEAPPAHEPKHGKNR